MEARRPESRSRLSRRLATVASLAALVPAAAEPGVESRPRDVFEPVVWGLELPVRDVAASAKLYREALGFETVLAGGELARLERDGLELLLVASTGADEPAGAAGIHFELEVSDLERALERALAAGMRAPDAEPRTLPIGRCVSLLDTDGHLTNLIDLDPERGSGADRLEVFRVGLNLEAGADWEFVTGLGFRVLTRKHEPDALPIEKTGAAELVLRREALRARQPGTKSAALLLATPELESARAALAGSTLLGERSAPRPSPFGRRLALSAPSGLRLELLERSPAQLAFEQLEALAGSWEGKSSQGWTARAEIEVIARGSAVLERTNFEAHPGETMLTLFHRDGARLVLTHYCVAGNQPTLAATEIEPARLHFTFDSATNLASRDQGHMDEAVLELEGPDAFSSKWSYYQAGQTSWMEQIHYRRLGAPAEAAARPQPGPSAR